MGDPTDVTFLRNRDTVNNCNFCPGSDPRPFYWNRFDASFFVLCKWHLVPVFIVFNVDCCYIDCYRNCFHYFLIAARRLRTKYNRINAELLCFYFLRNEYIKQVISVFNVLGDVQLVVM